MSMAAADRRISRARGRPESADPFVVTSLFLLFAIGSWRIQFVGTLPLYELAFVPLLLVMLVVRRGGFPGGAVAMTIFGAGAAWFAAQAASDWINETAAFDSIRGLANIAVFLLTIFVWRLILSDVRHGLLAAGLGLCVGAFIQALLQPDQYQQTDVWKFGLGHPMTFAVALLVGHSRLNGRLPASLVLVGLAILHFSFGSRTLAAASFLAGFMTFVLGARSLSQRANVMGMAVVALGIAVAAIGAQVAYQWALESPLMPQKMRSKFESQAASDLGLILSARSELLVSTKAIREKPWIGYGSWARDEGFANELLLLRLASGQSMLTAYVEDDYIPSHSHIFGAWVQAGLVGALFWAYALVLLAVALWRLGPTARPEGIAQSYLLLTFAWDVLFSPLSLGSRVWSALAVAVLVSLASSDKDASRRAIARGRRAAPGNPARALGG